MWIFMYVNSNLGSKFYKNMPNVLLLTSFENFNRYILITIG